MSVSVAGQLPPTPTAWDQRTVRHTAAAPFDLALEPNQTAHVDATGRDAGESDEITL